MPASDLYALPVAALIDADGKHLIERHTLRVAPSVGTVIQLEDALRARASPATPAALVVGVDRSLSRLERGGRVAAEDLPETALLVRADAQRHLHRVVGEAVQRVRLELPAARRGGSSGR